tara:strand:+ start:121 stop:570 length:450 start_codon:yes stop_codon:yes gene_type:complete
MKEVKYIKGYNPNIPTWSEIIENLNTSWSNGGFIKNITPGFFVCHQAQQIEKVRIVLKDLECKYAHSYINVLQSSRTFGEHNDTMDVNFWQGEGITKWIINGDKEYLLYPGDLIMVPKGIDHNVKPLTPRFGISFSVYDHIESNNENNR